MNPTPDPLEKLIHDTLQELPQRKAPRSLEMRVMAELARRQALPWWQKSWAHWPAAVRWSFLVISAAFAAAMIFGFVSLFRSGSLDAVSATVSKPLTWLSMIVGTARALSSAFSDMFGAIPGPWLYGGLAALGFVYATVFSLGATAYRLLWQTR